MSVGKFRDVKATRKEHRCESCERPIPFGSPAKYWAGLIEGDFYALYQHVDCREAEVAWNDHAEFAWDEHCPLWLLWDDGRDPGFFDDDVTDFHPTLQERWPEVYARLEARAAVRAAPEPKS